VNASQSTVSSTRRNHRAWGVIAAATVVVALSALPAAARQDAGQIDQPSQATSSPFCTPERVGTQFVACDNLTGNGVPAPAWVHER